MLHHTHVQSVLRAPARVLGLLLAVALLMSGFTPLARAGTSPAPAAAADPAARAFSTLRVNDGVEGTEPSGPSEEAAVSDDGRYVVFESDADNLFAGQQPSDDAQLYRRDLETGDVVLVSATTTGAPAEGSNREASVSADGRYVAFSSAARDLAVPSNSSGDWRVYVRDVLAGKTFLVSVAGRGREPQISDDGAKIVFSEESDYPHELATAVPGDADGADDAAVWESAPDGTTLLTTTTVPGTTGETAVLHELSGDGNVLAYYEGWNNATWTEQTWFLKVHDLTTGTTEDLGSVVQPLNMNHPWSSMRPPALTDDGSKVGYVVIELERDVAYVRDMAEAAPEQVAVSTFAQRLDHVELSDDGRHVVYALTEPGPDQLEVGGWHGGTTEEYALSYRLEEPCWLRPRDEVATQLYRLDRVTGVTTHLTVNAEGEPGQHSCAVDISGNGEVVTFQSYAADLVEGALEPGELDYDVFAATVPVAGPAVRWPAGAALSAEDVSSSTLRLVWDAAEAGGAEITGYRVFRGDDLIDEVAATSRSLVVSGLEAQTTYAFAVEAVDADGATTPRLPVTVTTTDRTGVPGSAPLVVAAEPGGEVQLSWDAAPGASGYRVLRAAGSGELGTVADLPSTARSHVDTGLPAQTTYRYLVMALVGSAPHPHTVERTVDVGPVTAVAVTLDAPRAGLSGAAVPGSDVQVRLLGEPHRSGRATITYTDWYGDGDVEQSAPAAETATVELEETAPGLYTGTFRLRDGIASVTSAVGVLADGAGHASAEVSASGVPVPVAGTVAVDVVAAAEALPDARLFLWSASRRAGAQQRLSGGGPLQLVAPAADDYVARIVRADGREAARTELAVRPGRVTPTQLTPALPSTLSVAVVDPHGAALPADVQVLETGTGTLRTGSARPDAPAQLTTLNSGQLVRITTRVQAPPGSLLSLDSMTEHTLVPGDNAVTVTEEELPHGRLEGQLRGDGTPLSAATVRVTQHAGGHQRVFTTTTGADGRYALEALAGPALVDFSHSRYRTTNGEVTVLEGQSTTLDRDIVEPRRYLLDVNLFTRYLGDADFLEQDLDWRVAIHFGLSIDAPNGRWSGALALPTEIRGMPGEVVDVCADGREAGLPSGCSRVTLPENAHGEVLRLAADLRLTEFGALRATLLDAAGAAHTGPWTAKVHRVEANGTRTFVRAASGSGPVRAPVAAAGDHVLEVWATDLRWRSSVVTVAEGEEVTLPELRPVTDGPFSGAGSGVNVSRASVLPDAAVEVRTSYRHSGGAPAAGVIARLEVPTGTTVLPESVLLDGQPVPGALRDGFYEVELGTVPPGATGVLRHTVRLNGVEAGSALQFESRLSHGTAPPGGEVLGTARVGVAGLTLSAPRRVPSTTVPVSGRAPAGSSVGIYTEGVLLGRAEATPGGFWSASVGLPDRGELHTHVLYAEAVRGERTLRSDTEPVTFDSSHLVAAEITVQQDNGRRIAFDPAKGVARFPYVYVPGHPMVVEARFADPDRVENVRVRIGSREAPAVRADGVFRARVDADGRGGIFVDYDVVAAPVRADDPPGGALTEAQVRDRLPAPLRDFSVRGEPVYTEDGDVRRGSFTLDVPGEEAALVGTVEVEKDQEYTVTAEDAERERLSGSPLYGLELTERREGDKIVVELSGHVPQDQLGVDEGVLSDVVGFFSRALGGDDDPSLTTSSAAAGAVVQTARVGYQMAFNVATNGDSLYQAITAGGKYEDVEKLYTAVSASGCDAETKDIYRGLADSAAKQAMIVDGLNVVLTVAGAVLAPATFGIGTVALWGVGWLAGKAMDFALAAQVERAQKSIADAAAFCQREGRIDLDDLDDVDPRPPDAEPVWIFDPSGYVYEAVPSNRLAGVTATVLQKDETAGTWAAWDAEWFGQDNPQVTGADGRYGWDVPEGLWQVVYGKEGYEQGRSAELRVLPPHFDVNVGLVSLAAPQVEQVRAVAGGPVEIRFDRYMQPETVLAAVQVRRGGSLLEGTVAPVDAEASPAGPTYARTFRFSPTAPLVEGEVLRVSVDELAENYAQRTLEADVERDVTVAAPVTVPAAPQSVAAAPGDGAVTLTWQPPASDGGSAITGYTVTSEPATTTLTLPASTTSTRVEGLTNGTAYRFTVAAVNAVGTGPGATSDSVSPRPATSGGGGGGGHPSSPPTSPPPPLPSPSSSPKPTPTSSPGGSTGSSSDGPPSEDEPVVVRVTSPRAGEITFEQGSGRSPRGFVAAGRPWVIEAPEASVQDPLELVFRVDASALREGIPVGVFRDGTLATGCTSQTAAEPDPCLLRASVLDDGDVELVVLSAHASSWQVAQPESGSIDGACARGLADPFGDTAGSVHRAAIACLADRGITTGTSPTTFAPAGQVTRAQMASFVARLLDRAGVELPASPEVSFVDVPAGAAHATAVGQLAELGVVRGFSSGAYRPGDVVSRAQMASFLTRAYDLTTEVELPTSQQFDDVTGDAHEQAIGTIAALGITEGVTPTSYLPGKPVTREQMASFLARTLNLLVVAGKVTQD